MSQPEVSTRLVNRRALDDLDMRKPLAVRCGSRAHGDLIVHHWRLSCTNRSVEWAADSRQGWAIA